MADLYPTSGTLVTSGLDQALTQRKLEARQAMLDALNQKNVESEISYRGEQAKSLADERSAQADQRREASLSSTAGHLHMGQDLGDMKPDLLQALIERGYANPGVTPEDAATTGGLDVGTGSRMLVLSHDKDGNFGAPPDPEANATGVESIKTPNKPSHGPEAVGSPKENDDESQREREDWFMRSGIMGRPDMTPIDKAIAWSTYMGGKPMPTQLLQPPGKLVTVDDASGTAKEVPGISLNPNDKVQNIPRPPRAAQPPQPQFVGAQGTNGVIFQDGHFRTEPLPDGQPLGPRVEPPSKSNGLYDTAAYAKFNQVNLNPNATDQDKLAVKSTVINSIQDPDLRHDVSVILGNDRYLEIPVDSLISSGVIEPPQGASPEQAQEYLRKVKVILNALGKQ